MTAPLISAASTEAHQFDQLFTMLVIFSLVIVVLVAVLLIGFSVRFRRGSDVTRHKVSRIHSREVEIGWTAATAFVAVFIFWWMSSTSLQRQDAPKNAMQIHVTAKQWMWKASHENGVRELDSLHIPVGEPVQLYLDSQDVIHSFFVPAFRLKQDVVPGRTASLWFTATEPGRFPILCAEYCGTSHSAMTGEIVAMEPADFSRWLDSRPDGTGLAAAGRDLFTTAGCSGCHDEAAAIHAPDLAGLYGRKVPLADGRVVEADTAYLRDSILLPRQDVAAGYKPIMPDFAGLLDDGEVEALIAYIRSLGGTTP